MELLKSLPERAVAEIEKVLVGEVGMSKVAIEILGNYARIKSLEVHNKALEIMLARGVLKG